MLVCFENLEPENNNSCVTTAPRVPPLPVIPDMTPSDLQNHILSNFDTTPSDMQNHILSNDCVITNYCYTLSDTFYLKSYVIGFGYNYETVKLLCFDNWNWYFNSVQYIYWVHFVKSLRD